MKKALPKQSFFRGHRLRPYCPVCVAVRQDYFFFLPTGIKIGHARFP
nr:MAG TPA: hypothetical protein [Caudoviricetes sp.]